MSVSERCFAFDFSRQVAAAFKKWFDFGACGKPLGGADFQWPVLWAAFGGVKALWEDDEEGHDAKLSKMTLSFPSPLEGEGPRSGGEGAVLVISGFPLSRPSATLPLEGGGDTAAHPQKK